VAALVALEAFWGVGVAFVSFDIVSALIYSLGGGPLLVALASTLVSVLVYAPQFFVPYLQQRIRNFVAGAALGQGIIVLPYLINTVALATPAKPSFLLALIIVGIAAGAVGNALNYPFYQQLRVRIFPSRIRSASYSTVIFFSSIAGAIGAAFSVVLMTAWEGPSRANYICAYAICSVFCIVSTACLFLVRDPNPPAAVSASARRFSLVLQDFLQIFRSDRNLRVFLLSEWMNWLSSMGSTFLAFYAVGLFGESIAAQCGFSRSIATLLTVPIAHLVVSRLGPRRAIISFYLCAITFYFMLVLPSSRFMILFASFLLGSVQIFRINYLFHFIAALCPESDKTRYFALCSVAVSPCTVIGPFLGGWLVNTFGSYRLVFAVAILPLLIGLWLVWKVLKDPSTEPPDDRGVVPRVALKRMTG
jgi:MFS family permease